MLTNINFGGEGVFIVSYSFCLNAGVNTVYELKYGLTNSSQTSNTNSIPPAYYPFAENGFYPAFSNLTETILINKTVFLNTATFGNTTANLYVYCNSSQVGLTTQSGWIQAIRIA
jgi:hypothetical protein